MIVQNLIYMVCFTTANKTFKGSFTGISIGSVTETQKIWRSFQALGDIAFAYSFSIILIEIQVLQKAIVRACLLSFPVFSC